LTLETSKTETAQFQHRYHQNVGRLDAQLNELDALIASVQAGLTPDDAATEPEQLRRTVLLAQVNLAYERGDQQAIEKLVSEYGQDPEAITDGDLAKQLLQELSERKIQLEIARQE